MKQTQNRDKGRTTGDVDLASSSRCNVLQAQVDSSSSSSRFCFALQLELFPFLIQILLVIFPTFLAWFFSQFLHTFLFFSTSFIDLLCRQVLPSSCFYHMLPVDSAGTSSWWVLEQVALLSQLSPGIAKASVLTTCTAFCQGSGFSSSSLTFTLHLSQPHTTPIFPGVKSNKYKQLRAIQALLCKH